MSAFSDGLWDVNPHMALGLAESEAARGTDEDIAWEKWLKKAAELIGVDHLDGDESEDGYSLDMAYADFEHGYTPENYAATVAENRALIRERAIKVKDDPRGHGGEVDYTESRGWHPTADLYRKDGDS